MADNQKIKYNVKKVTEMRKMCSACGGTGKIERRFGVGQFKTENCLHCTNGVAIMEHHTEISLIEALTELGIRFVLPENMKPKN